jgi:hypothetical protein
MTETEKAFHRLADEIPGLNPSKMFGAVCLKTKKGKSAAMLWNDELVVKLDKDELDKALRRKGTKLFEPMKGKAMKEWVQIPRDFITEWKTYVQMSVIKIESV